MFKATARPLYMAAVILGLGLMAGCASQSNVSEPPRSSTLSDAQDHARGGRDRAKSASQINFGFGNTQTTDKQAATDPSHFLREIAVTRTFLGTTSCPTSSTSCMPLRLNITLSPQGIWRMRAIAVNTDLAPVSTQGCWYQTGTEPTRIILQNQNNVVIADLSFMNDQQLRINTFNAVRPTLETHLSRQPDVDSIAELDNQTGPTCRSSSK